MGLGEPSLERQVRAALGHLYDLGRLQLHPLARLLPPQGDGASAARALQRELRGAVEVLRSGPEGRGRGHDLLRLRYLEGLDVAAVQSSLAIGHTEYFREQARAIAAVAGLLRERWALGASTPKREPGSSAASTRLPVPLTSLIGRERDVVAVERRLEEARLVTLTGPPGAGKTRLAVEVATRAAAGFADGVVFVPLAPVSDPALVVPTIGQALGLREVDARPLSELVVAHLGERRILLVLDNLEQVVVAAPSIAQLLARCPEVRVLATSREALRIGGERLYLVAPLSVDASVCLFVERAQSVAPDLVLAPAGEATIAEICRRLDGLPLAIELAAARANLLPPPALLARLDARLELLTAGPRDADDRHRTLRAAIGWSYELLRPAERALFRRLAVFAGGATLDAILAVCSAEGPGSTAELAAREADLDDLAALVAGSLLTREDETRGQPRFAMLDTVGEYGRERLAAEDDEPAAYRRHAEYFLALVERSVERTGTSRQAECLEQLDREHANLRAALAWWLRSLDAEAALRFGAAAWSFWALRGHMAEGRQELTRILALPDAAAPTRARALCLRGLGRLALNQSDTAEAERCFEGALAIAQRIDDGEQVLPALHGLGRIAVERRDFAAARARLEEAEALRQGKGLPFHGGTRRLLGLISLEEGDLAAARVCFEQVLAEAREQGHQHDLSLALAGLGHVAHAEGDAARARSLYEAGLALQRRFGDKRAIAQLLANLGMVAVDLADVAAARAHLTEGLTTARELGDRAVVALALEGFAGLAAAQARPARAALLERAARELRESGVAARPRTVGDWLAGWLQAARAAGGAATPAGAAAGSVDLEEAVAVALGDAAQ